MDEMEKKQFEKACSHGFCLECGKPVSHEGVGRPRIFCSDRCRWAYNKRKQRKRRREAKDAETTSGG